MLPMIKVHQCQLVSICTWYKLESSGKWEKWSCWN